MKLTSLVEYQKEKILNETILKPEFEFCVCMSLVTLSWFE